MNNKIYSHKKKKHITIPVFIPELACPHQCVFCNQEKITGKKLYPGAGIVDEIVNKYSSTIVPDDEVELAFFGGNFTGIDINEQIKFLSSANKYVETGLLQGLRISTRPDYISDEILDLLEKYNVKTIELGAQSMNNHVLNKAGRGHKVQDIIDAAEKIKARGFSLGLQMMIGLPGDTYETSLETAEKIIELGANNTRIYPTLVIRDTYLEKLYLQGKYTPLTLDEAVSRTKEIYLMFEKAGVYVLRTGLHPSEGFTSGEELVAGPFFINFKELVMTEIWNDIFTNYFTKSDKRQDIKLYVNPAEFNFAVGFGSKNKSWLGEKFRKVKFYPDQELEGRDFLVVYC